MTGVQTCALPISWVSLMGTVLAVAGLFLSEYNGKGMGAEKMEEKSTKEQED